jgi:uncharacterized protein YyaL (SSP411 family)
MQIQKEFDQFLWSTELRGYYNTSATDSPIVRERSYDDSALPSANGVAIANLVRLFLLTKDMTYLERAEQALHAFSRVMVDTPQRCPSLFAALDWFRNQTLIQTDVNAISNLNLRYLPTAIFQVKVELDSTDSSRNVTGLVCQGLSCQTPAQRWEQLQEQVQQSIARG